MKGWKKSLLALMGAVCLTFAAKTTVRAAETPAPFTAEQLMAAVNAQCANVSSLQEVLAESVQMTEASSGITVSADMVMDVQQSRTVSHSTVSMVMSMMGITEGRTVENYSVISGTTLCSYVSDQYGGWEVSYEALTPAQLVDYTAPFGISGIDTATAVVTVDGNVCRVRGVMDAASMETFAELMESSGIAADSALPVVLDIDAATLLPISLSTAMQNLTVSDIPGMTATVNVVMTFAGYNQYDGLAVPAAVIANAA